MEKKFFSQNSLQGTQYDSSLSLNDLSIEFQLDKTDIIMNINDILNEEIVKSSEDKQSMDFEVKQGLDLAKTPTLLTQNVCDYINYSPVENIEKDEVAYLRVLKECLDVNLDFSITAVAIWDSYFIFGDIFGNVY